MSKENNLKDYLTDMSNVFRLAYGDAPNSETHKFNPQDFVDNIAIPNIAFVDLGDLTWTMEVGSGDVIITRFYATMPNDCINTQSVDVVNLYTEKYENSASVISSRNEDKKIALYSTNADEVKVYICDNNSAYATADAFKAAVKEVKLFYGVNLGGKLTYLQFTERLGLDLTITEYVKAMYLEAPVFGIGVNVINDSSLQQDLNNVKLYYLPLIADLESKGLRLTPYIYCQGFETISDGRSYTDLQPFYIYTDNPQASGSRIYITLPLDWTDEQCKAYLKGKKILYKLKYVDITNKGTVYNYNCVMADMKFPNEHAGNTMFIPINGAKHLRITVSGADRLGVGQWDTIISNPPSLPKATPPNSILYPGEIVVPSETNTIEIDTTSSCKMIHIYLNALNQINYNVKVEVRP